MLRILTIIVPTFVMKVTKYLCSGFFLQTKFEFSTSHFNRIFLHQSKSIVNLSLNLKDILPKIHFLLSYGGLKIAILANLGQLTRDIFRANKA